MTRYKTVVLRVPSVSQTVAEGFYIEVRIVQCVNFIELIKGFTLDKITIGRFISKMFFVF